MKIFSVIILLFGLIGMAGNVIWVIRKGNSNKMTKLFIMCQNAIILWLISQLLILESVTRHQLWISYIIGNTGISIFAPFWLMFSAEYVDIGKSAKKFINFMPLVSLSSIILIITNPIHRLYYSWFDMDGKKYAVLFYIYQFIHYSCIISGITMMCIKHTNSEKHISRQAILLTLSTAVPLAINTLTVTRVINAKIELTPLFFAFSSMMILLALSRYGLLNVNSIAMRDIVANIDSGVIIFDANENMSYKNSFAEKMLEIPKNTDISAFCRMISEKSGISIDIYFSSAETVIDGEYISIKQTFCNNKSGTRVARIITLNNVTEYHELAKAEKKLSIEQERNRIAQEIHDSAGHTFTMISSLARILEVECEKNSPNIKNYISEIDSLSRSGVTQLRCSINNLREDEFMTSVTKAVKTVTDALRNIETEVCVQGTENESYSFCIKEIYDNCRETITNSVRYSNADRIDVIIKFLDIRLELYIFDNGKGCKEIKENNGLRGIRERTEKLGGSVKFSSVEGEGFTTIIKIPVTHKVDY